MGKYLIAALGVAAAAGAAIWQKVEADRAEKDLWAEVSDAVE